MKRACPYCGKIHDKKYVCEMRPEKRYPSRSSPNREDKFRWSYEWKMKREYILKRDRYLCVACINNLEGTVRRLNNVDLSVHHIRPLKTNWELRLCDENLITLCRNHHEMAEKFEIAPENLIKLLQNTPPEGR
jgi:5-methylcytosine-specific restriction endonuclease McrA